jgi:hypothetical protein
MRTVIEVTNQRLFDLKVTSVNTEGLQGLHGTIEIELTPQSSIVSTGEHGVNDYKDEFGFILKVLFD